MGNLSRFVHVALLAGVVYQSAWSAPLSNEYRTCFDGFVLTRSNLCVQEVNEEPRITCSVGSLDGKGCKVQVPKIRRCAEGFSLDAAGGCSYIVPVDVQYFCPADSRDNGEACEFLIPSEVETYCDEHAERINDQCVAIRRADPITLVSCPPEASFEDNRCWKVADRFECNRDCKIHPGAAGCDKKNKLPPNHIRSLVGAANSEPEASKPLVPATPPRQYHTIIVAQTCERRYEVPSISEQQCPPGFHIDAKGCFVQEISSVKQRCLSQQNGDVRECSPLVKMVPKIERCSNGSAPIHGKCFEIVNGDIIEYCPNGFIDHDGQCEGYIEPVSQCGPDLVQRAGRCIGRRSRAPIVITDGAVLPSNNTTRASIKELKEIFHLKPKA